MININEMFSIVKDMKIETLKDNATFQELDSFVSELKNSSNPQHRFMALRLENRLKENQNYQEYRKSIELKAEEKREIDHEKKINKEFDEKQAVGGRVMDAKKKAEVEKIKKEEKELADFSLKNLSFNQQMMKIQMLMDNFDKYNFDQKMEFINNMNNEFKNANTEDKIIFYGEKGSEVILKSIEGKEYNKQQLEQHEKVTKDHIQTMILKANENSPVSEEMQHTVDQVTKNDIEALTKNRIIQLIEQEHPNAKVKTFHGKYYVNGQEIKTMGDGMDIGRKYELVCEEITSNIQNDKHFQEIFKNIKIGSVDIEYDLANSKKYKDASQSVIEELLKLSPENKDSIAIMHAATKKIIDENIENIKAKDGNLLYGLTFHNATLGKIRNFISGVSQDVVLDENMQKLYKENPQGFKGYITAFGFSIQEANIVSEKMKSFNDHYTKHPEEKEKLLKELENRSESENKSLLYLSQNIDMFTKYMERKFDGGKHSGLEFQTLFNKVLNEQMQENKNLKMGDIFEKTIEELSKKYNISKEIIKQEYSEFLKDNKHLNKLEANNYDEYITNINKHITNFGENKFNNVVNVDKSLSKEFENQSEERNKHYAQLGYNSEYKKVNIQSYDKNWDVEFSKGEDPNSSIIANKAGNIMQATINGENQKMIEESQQPDNKPSYAENANKILRQMQEQEKEEMERQNNINLASNTSTKA